MRVRIEDGAGLGGGVGAEELEEEGEDGGLDILGRVGRERGKEGWRGKVGAGGGERMVGGCGERMRVVEVGLKRIGLGVDFRGGSVRLVQRIVGFSTSYSDSACNAVPSITDFVLIAMKLNLTPFILLGLLP